MTSWFQWLAAPDQMPYASPTDISTNGTDATVLPQPSGLGDITKEQAKGVLNHLFVHDAAEKLAIGRAAAAVGWGVEPSQFVTKFGSQGPTGNTFNVTDTKTSPSSDAATGLKIALLTAGLALLFGGGGLIAAPLLSGLFSAGAAAVAPPAATAPAAPAGIQPGTFDIDLEFVPGEGIRATGIRPVK